MDGEIQETEQQPANAEAQEQATSLLRELQDQSHALRTRVRDSMDGSLDAGADACNQGSAVPTGSSGDAINELPPIAATNPDVDGGAHE